MTIVPPVRAIAIDHDTALALVRAMTGAVGEGIDEENGITRFQRHFDSALDVGIAEHSIVRFEGRVNQIRLVTARNNSCGAVAIQKIRQRHQHVDLPTSKLAIVITELCSDPALVCTRVKSAARARAMNRHEGLVDEEPIVAPPRTD